MTALAVLLMGAAGAVVAQSDDPQRPPRIEHEVDCPKELNGVPVTACVWPLDRDEQQGRQDQQ